MTADERAQREARAERCLRRGELSEALQLYQALGAAFPDDDGFRAKLERIQENLQPSELMNPKARMPAEPPPTDPEQEGERLYALGDFAGAAAAYRRALDARPGSELIRERLFELFRLAQSAPARSPTDDALPSSPEDKLNALLDRISARKLLRRS